MTITLKETNDFPPQVVPVSSSVCKEATPEASGLVLTAVDQDFPPHAAPFLFELPDDPSSNWTVSQLNSTEGDSSEARGRNPLGEPSHRSLLPLRSHPRRPPPAGGAGAGGVRGPLAGVGLRAPGPELFRSRQRHRVPVRSLRRLQICSGSRVRLQRGDQLHRPHHRHGQCRAPAA